MSEKQIVNRVKKLLDLEAQKAALEKQIGAVKAEIQADMQDTDELRAGAYLIRWPVVKSERVDTSAMRKDYPNLCTEYTKTVESRRFSIREG